MKFLLLHHRLDEGRSGHDLVAEVEADDAWEVFTISQHRGGPSWTLNNGVKAYTENPRSSDFGDIMVSEELEVYRKVFLGVDTITDLGIAEEHKDVARKHWKMA